MPAKVFVCYAHEDEPLLNKFKKHLKPLQQQGLIEVWHDHDIRAGSEWEREIIQNINEAQIILLLVSPNFMASDYCFSIEMKRALERHELGEALVVPIILRSVTWQGAPFEKLRVLPSNGKTADSSYWHNLDAAFADIVGDIRLLIKQQNLSSASVSSVSQCVWFIPHKRNPLFTGRDKLLMLLHENFITTKASSSTSTSIQAITGLGGIGKTQIAIEYAYRYRHEYRFVFWARAASYEVLFSDFVVIADLLQLTGKNAQDQSMIVAAAQAWFANHTEWLLILDNVEDLDLIYTFLPNEINGHIVLTTRSQAVGPVAHRVEVEKMSKEDGSLLLLRRAKVMTRNTSLETIPESERIKAAAIVDAVDGLPLALDQAGAYIEETGCNLSVYLSLYGAHNQVLLLRRGKFSMAHPEPVATTWALSFKRVEELNAFAADLLRLFAFLDPDAIPEEIISIGAAQLGPRLSQLGNNSLKLNEAIGQLLAYSLVRRHIDRGLSIHRLVQVILKMGMDQRTQRRWAQRTVRAVGKTFPAVAYGNWLRCQYYLPQVYACINLIEQWDMNFPEVTLLLMQTGHYLRESSQYAQAEPFFQKALSICERQADDYPHTAAILNELAVLYRQQGQFAKAESLFQKALSIRERVLGEHADTATTLDDLAVLYRLQSRFELAEPLFQKALSIRERVLGEHADTATTLHNLASLYRQRNEFAKAESLYQRALAIYELLLGDHPFTAAALDNLAALYHEQNRFEQAEPLYLRALSIRERLLGDHHFTATTLNNLASLYQDQGRYEQAEPLFQRSLTIHEQLLGDHPDTATTLHCLAVLYQLQGCDEQAESLFQKALTIRKRLQVAP